MEQTERRLIGLFEARNEQAISETQRQYGTLCRNIAYGILGSEQDAEECVSDAMMRLWNSIPPEKPESFRAYLITLTKRLALDRLRADRAAKRGGGAAESELDALAEIMPAADDTAAAAENRLLKEALGRFLGGLPQETRIIFVEHYWFRSPVNEIAAEHKMGRSAVKMSLLRTRRKLEAFLKGEGYL